METEQLTGNLSAPVYLTPSGSDDQVKQSHLRLVLANDPSLPDPQAGQVAASQAVTFIQIADDSFVQDGSSVPQLYQLVPESFPNQQVLSQQEPSSKSTQDSSSNNPISLTSVESVNPVPVTAGQVSLIESNGQQYLILPNFSNHQFVIQNQSSDDQPQSRTVQDIHVSQASNEPAGSIQHSTTDAQYSRIEPAEKQNLESNDIVSYFRRPYGKPPSALKFHDTTEKGVVTNTTVLDRLEMTDLIPSFFRRTALQKSEISGPMRCSLCKFEAKSLEELQAHSTQHKSTNDTQSSSTSSSTMKKKIILMKKKKQMKSKKAQMIRTEPAEKPPEVTLPTTCSVCHHEIKTLGQYRKHLKQHKNDKPHRCNECGESFNKEHNLKLHLSIHNKMKSNSGLEKYECPECKKVFNRMASLKMHILLHAEDESFICKECGDEFACNEDLETHVADHDIDLARHLHDKVKGVSQKPDGNIKNKQTSTISDPPQSVIFSVPGKTMVHPQPPPRLIGSHQCSICLKYFQKRFQLQRHMLIHTGEKPHSCETCGRSFNQKSALQKHMSLHSGEKPFSCPHCPQTYRQRGNLNLHIKRVHLLPNDGQETFACKDCQCVFKKIGSLHAHVTKYHIQKSLKLTSGPTAAQGQTDIVNQALEASIGEINPEPAAMSILNDTAERQQSGTSESQTNRSVPMSIEHRQTQSSEASLPMNTQADIIASTSNQSAAMESQQIESLVAVSPNSNTTQNGSLGQNTSDASGSGNVDASFLALSAMSVSNIQADEVHGNDSEMRKIVIVNGVRYHRCALCNKGFKKPSDLTRHIRIHTLERPYKCKQCGRAFTVKSSLKSHIRSHLGIKPHRCQVCHKSFTTGSSLRIHQRLHTGARPFPCPHCDKRFRTTGHRTNHMLSHAKKNSRLANTAKTKKKLKPDLSHVQLLSPLVVTSTGQLRFHNSGGTNSQNNSVKTLTCKVCSKTFISRSSLKLHSATHNVPRPFICEICKKSFTTKACLKEHFKTHSKNPAQTNFKCDICERHFSTKRSLNRHAITHSKERPFMCPYCQKMFKSSETCRKHMQTHRQEVAVMQSNDSGPKSSSTYLTSINTGSFAPGNENIISRLPIFEETLDGSYIMNIPETCYKTVEGTPNPVNPNLVQDLSNITSPPNIVSQTQQSTILLSPTPRQSISGLAISNEQQLTLEELASLAAHQNQTDLSLFELEMPTNPDGSALSLAVEQPLYVDNLNFLENITGETSQSFAATSLPTAPSHNATAQPNETPTAHPDSLPSSKLTTVVLEQPNQRGKFYGAKVLKTGRTNMYQCLGCEAVFLENEFEDHVESFKNKEEELPFLCDHCCHRLPTQLQHTSHSRFHTIDTGVVFKCSTCGIGFDNRKMEEEHNKSHPPSMNTVHEEKEGEKFVRKVSANAESKTSQAASKSRSNFVKLTQEQNDMLSQTNPNLHMTVSERVLLSAVAEKDRVVEKVAEGRGRFKALEINGPVHKCACPHCPKSFKKHGDLTRHIRTHTGEKPFACKVCNKRFSIKSYLTTHEKTHTGVKEYACHICNLMYASKASLKVHMRLHTGGLPFKCPHCPKRFRTSGHRITHIKTHTTRKAIVKDKGKQQEEYHDDTQGQSIDANNVMLSDLTLTLPEGIIQGSGGLQLQLSGQNLQLINGGKDANENITLQIDPASLQQAMDNITPTVSQDVIRNYTRPVSSGPAPNLVIQPITLPESVVRDLSNGSGANEVNIAVPASLASLTQMLFQSPNSIASNVEGTASNATLPTVPDAEKGGEDITLTASAADLTNQGLQPFPFELLTAEDIQQTTNPPFS